MSAGRLVEVPCPVCASEQSRFIGLVKDYVMRVTDDSFGVRECSRCGVGFLSPRPAPEQIGRFYPDEFYWSFEQADRPLSAAAVLAQRGPQLKHKLHYLEHLPRGQLLDIGAMKGEFVRAATNAGWRAQGVEFSPSVPNLFNVPIRYGEFLDMDFSDASFSCVTMWAVLEHVYQPRAYVQQIARLLARGGTFIGVVTNFHSLQARLLRADDYPRHLTLFTKRSLRELFEAAGLELVRFWTDQRLFGGALSGGLLYGVKRLCGYSTDEVFYEMRDRGDPELFCCKFRGRASTATKWISRLDRAALWLPEKVLDSLGFGLNLGFEARKRA
jgi:SAM-dependent methyltransferase